MNFNSDEIFELARTIWSATLGMPIEADLSGRVASRPRSTAACIHLTGKWNGAILLDCRAQVASRVAGVMFSTEPASVTLSEIQDAVAELVNMLGGNIKALLPETCYLSLPAVVEGGDYSACVPGSRLVSRVSFLCEGHPVSISILEKKEEESAAA